MSASSISTAISIPSELANLWSQSFHSFDERNWVKTASEFGVPERRTCGLSAMKTPPLL